MSNSIVDGDDGWKVPENVPATDHTHAARVRFLSAAIAQRILAIPPDVSKQGRAVRIGKVKQRVREWVDWLNATYIQRGGDTVRVTSGRQRDAWLTAMWEAEREITAALNDGASLTAFLFPSDVEGIAS